MSIYILVYKGQTYYKHQTYYLLNECIGEQEVTFRHLIIFFLSFFHYSLLRSILMGSSIYSNTARDMDISLCDFTSKTHIFEAVPRQRAFCWVIVKNDVNFFFCFVGFCSHISGMRANDKSNESKKFRIIRDFCWS